MPESTLDSTSKQNQTDRSTDIWKTLSFARETLICVALSAFLIQPLLQLLMRFIERTKVSRLQYPDLTRYETSIDATHKIMIITAVTLFLCFIAFAVYSRLNRDLIPAAHRISLLDKETAYRLVPFFLFVLFSVGILLSTIIRGSGSYDMIGHWYMHESIFSYITYALAYFLCAMLLWSDTARKIILFLLVGTALPLHLLVLVDQWGTPISYFVAKGLGTIGVTAVFFNSNHYGYYIMLSLLTAALLFVYEKNPALRILCAACGIVSTIALIINNTLGAYLACLFVLVLFVVYCLTMDKPHSKQAFMIFGTFMLITFLMSFHYDTILSSFLTFFSDVGMIISDPLEADSGGSGRWRLWKETVRHIPEHPLVGFGIEGLLSLYGIGTPHNEFLQYAAFFGIPVLLYYTAACFIVLWRIFRNHRQMSDSTMVCFFVTIGYLASSFFGVTIFYTTPFLYILLGMTYAEYLKNGKQGSPHGTDSFTSANETKAPADNAGQISIPETRQTETCGNEQNGISLTGQADPIATSPDSSSNIRQADADVAAQIAEAREQGFSEGLTKGQEEGAELLRITLVCKKLQKQKTTEQIADDLEEDLTAIEAICHAAEETAPDYDAAVIFQKLHP